MARQLTIEGTEGPNIPAVNLAAEKYQTLQERASEAQRLVDHAEADLLAAMRAAKLKMYRDNEAVPPLIIRLTESTKEKLKVQTASVPVEKPIPGVAILEPRAKANTQTTSEWTATVTGDEPVGTTFSKVPPPKGEPEAKLKTNKHSGPVKAKSKGKSK